MKTKIFRVHFPGGVAVDVASPVGTILNVEKIVGCAQSILARYFKIADAQLVVKINARQTLPLDVALPVEPYVAPVRRRGRPPKIHKIPFASATDAWRSGSRGW